MKLLIAGDFCPIQRVENYLEDGHQELMGKFADLIEKADHTIVNLECPLTESKKPIDKTGPALKTNAKAALFLNKANIDIVTLANNHIMDYGEEGLRDTLNALKSSDIKYVGAALESCQLSEPLIILKDNVKVGILNFCENEWSTNYGNRVGANSLNPVRNYKSIKQLKDTVDYIVLIIHGGNEMYNLPSPQMKELYHFFIDAGANAIISHHTHCTSGYEVYNGAPIFYSLGNFLFDNESFRFSDWNFGSAVTLELNANDAVKFEIHYFNQCNDKPSIEMVENIGSINNAIQSLNDIILDDLALENAFNKYAMQQKKMYDYYIEPHAFKYLQALQNRKLISSLWSKRKKKYLSNLIRCESHRELLLNILNREG